MIEFENKILVGNSMDILKQLPEESIDCVMTSPPFYQQRDYEGITTIWDDPGSCNHEFKLVKKSFVPSEYNTAQVHRGEKISQYIVNVEQGFCECGAWKGQLGQEDDPELYIKHLSDVFDEVKRVLKVTGTIFVNMGDKYKDNSKLMIPARLAIELISRGWYLRNEIVWQKTSVIPESVTDRFTNDFELIYFLTKSPKYFFQMQYLPLRSSSNERAKYAVRKRKEQTGKGINTEGPAGERLANPIGRHMRCVWQVRTGNIRGNNHIAAYSASLCKTPILSGCPENGIVLDPFAGSGSTAIAALQLGRKYVGIEISPKAAYEAEERIKQLREYLKI